MGKLTMTQLITQGILLAGKNSTTALQATVLTSMNAWLRSTYKGWLWPYLSRKVSGIALAQGATLLTVGGGQGGVTHDIADIFDPIYLYTSTYTAMIEARVKKLRQEPIHQRLGVIDPTKNLGAPQQFQMRASETTEGQMELTPWPIPDKAYLLSFDYKMMPANLVAGDVPRYENDRTLLFAAKVCALEYMANSEEYNMEIEKLASMTAVDYAKDASNQSENSNLGLDTSTFRR